MQIIYITTSSKEQALEISHILVREKLLACANIFDHVTSVFEWQHSVNEEKEVVIIGKTADDAVDRLIERTKELHSYDCPCIVSWQAGKTNEDFGKWVDKQVSV